MRVKEYALNAGLSYDFIKVLRRNGIREPRNDSEGNSALYNIDLIDDEAILSSFKKQI